MGRGTILVPLLLILLLFSFFLFGNCKFRNSGLRIILSNQLSLYVTCPKKEVYTPQAVQNLALSPYLDLLLHFPAPEGDLNCLVLAGSSLQDRECAAIRGGCDRFLVAVVVQGTLTAKGE